MKTPNINEFKAWAIAHKQDALNVCKAQAFAACERERVDAYIRPIFDSYTFYSDPKMTDGVAEHITDPELLYLCDLDGEQMKQYHEDCDKAHRARGFDGPHGHCPALVADDLRRKAENVFLDMGCALFGLDHIPYMPEHRKKMLDLLMGACFVGSNKAQLMKDAGAI